MGIGQPGGGNRRAVVALRAVKEQVEWHRAGYRMQRGRKKHQHNSSGAAHGVADIEGL